jgi:hypothetical protein
VNVHDPIKNAHMPHSEIRSSTSKDQPLPVSSQNMESSSNRSFCFDLSKEIFKAKVNE